MDRSNIIFHSDNFNCILNDNTKPHVLGELIHVQPYSFLNNEEIEHGLHRNETIFFQMKNDFSLHIRSVWDYLWCLAWPYGAKCQNFQSEGIFCTTDYPPLPELGFLMENFATSLITTMEATIITMDYDHYNQIIVCSNHNNKSFSSN